MGDRDVGAPDGEDACTVDLGDKHLTKVKGHLEGDVLCILPWLEEPASAQLVNAVSLV